MSDSRHPPLLAAIAQVHGAMSFLWADQPALAQEARVGWTEAARSVAACRPTCGPSSEASCCTRPIGRLRSESAARERQEAIAMTRPASPGQSDNQW